MQIQYCALGQKATLFLETVDGYGVRTDGYIAPFISRIVFPDLSLATGFPQNMIKLDTGLYYFQFTLPNNALALGSYLAEAVFTNPANNFKNIQAYEIIVNTSRGMYSLGIN